MQRSNLRRVRPGHEDEHVVRPQEAHDGDREVQIFLQLLVAGRGVGAGSVRRR